tara:strand:+ start:368 stop:1312 length:945 start_codon:yes stop_codon:yes gene_type:complete
MSERNKFEEMLEKLVNEDRAGAEALFHEIVVEKSRSIYENLLEDDLEVDETTDEEVDEATDEEVDESSDEEVEESDEEVEESDEELEENFDLDEFEVEADPMDMDQSADMMRDLEMPDADADMDADDAEEGDMADDIADLQDEIEKLKAAFDAEMGSDMDSDDDEEGEEDDAEGDDGDEEEAPEEESFDLDVDEATDEEVEEADKSEAETMREYVEKVNATMGDNGANTKSPTASANKMGDGTSGNLNQGGESNSEGTKGGLADPTPKEDNMGNINVPGAKVGKTGMKAMSKGHGAEKKGAGETASDKKSIIGK